MTSKLYKTSTIGRKIEAVRKIREVSQETLASRLGMTRQNLFKLEQNGNIDETQLGQIADALGVSVDTIKNYDDDAVINYIQNNYNNTQAPNIFGDHAHVNSTEMWMQMIQENKDLYERLLKSEQEKIILLERMLQGKDK
ncbi:helix-turn-helix domain-containing protein [Taibaiella helva]|uniref:helix-turn-helix domain-containing protein n=1 Tax=Taibaiella helva TaxID=2301235 RepID=UPI001300B9B2|nr:helix-turn-helix transcriptional regulator [Taibaiella helva]